MANSWTFVQRISLSTHFDKSNIGQLRKEFLGV